MTRLLGFDPLQRATEFICRLMLEAPGCPSKTPHSCRQEPTGRESLP